MGRPRNPDAAWRVAMTLEERRELEHIDMILTDLERQRTALSYRRTLISQRCRRRIVLAQGKPA